MVRRSTALSEAPTGAVSTSEHDIGPAISRADVVVLVAVFSGHGSPRGSAQGVRREPVRIAYLNLISMVTLSTPGVNVDTVFVQPLGSSTLTRTRAGAQAAPDTASVIQMGTVS
jgi:hypothetical protein